MSRVIAEERSPGGVQGVWERLLGRWPQVAAQAWPAPLCCLAALGFPATPSALRKCGALGIRVRRGQRIQEEERHCKQHVSLSKDTRGCF